MLPDDVLLNFFDFYVMVDNDNDEDFGVVEKTRIEGWIALAHVCRRWRNVVFNSPRRLNLRLVCTPGTPARDTLNIWQPLPLIVRDGYWIDTSESSVAPVDNITAALEHSDRVCQINLSGGSGPPLEYIVNSAAMQRPFPRLTHLLLYGFAEKSIPDSFLGGTAPHLQSLHLYGISFPGLPKLLLSATHLIHLNLDITPLYIPPEAMATSLSPLTSLRSLCIRFPNPQLVLRPDLESRRPPPPLPRSILPNLTKIEFDGPSEYLEVIFARIDAPRLNKMHTIFYNEVTFDTPQFFQFISRRPLLRAPEKGLIAFNSDAIIFKFSSQTSDYSDLRVEITRTASEWQLSSLEQAWSSSFPPVPTLEDLSIFEDQLHPPSSQNDVENTQWLDFLRSFVALKNLYLSGEFVTRIAPALQELVGGRTTEVLPTLENIFLEGFQLSGPVHEGIEKFVAARRLTSQPVAVSLWDEDSKQEEERQYEMDNLPW